MEFPDDQVAELKHFSQDVQQSQESGIPYFYFPKLQLPDGCTPAEVDALFCPTSHHGYTSRLFFAERINPNTPKALNWSTTAHILGRTWHAISWQINQPDCRLAQTIAKHLDAFR
jgi:hypothetical protein